MGGSVSHNATNVVINAVAKITSKIVQDTKISYDSSQIIYIKDIKGDVIIRGNTIIQHAFINMKALFNAMTSESAQQNLALELAQSAKALTSGLNLGQYSEATNDLNVFIQTSIDLTTSISQSCAALASQEQKVIIEHVIGSVVIENNLFEQIASIFTDCIQTSISNSEALQSIILKLTQDSSATSQGLSPWVIVALLAVVMGVPAAGVAFVGKDFLKYIFPIMMVAGVIMIIVYYYTKAPIFPIKAYSKFIENTPACLADPQHPPPVTTYDSVATAANYCSKSSDCAAFDWKALNITQAGSYTYVKPPQSKFYKSVDPSCRTSIEEDNTNLIRAPVAYSGPTKPPDTIPNLIRGDIWIDTSNSYWYQLTLAWEQRGTLISSKFTKLTVQNTPPNPSQQGSDNDIIVVYDTGDPTVFNVYIYKSSWTYQGNVSGPGFFTYSPEQVNSSGVKESSGKEWLLYGGGSLVAVGLLGTIVTNLSGNKSKEPDQTKR